MKRKDSMIQVIGWLIILATIISPVLLSAKTLRGNGNQVVLKKNVTDFDKLRISHTFDARIDYGREYSVVVKVDENLKDYLIVKKKGNTLVVGMENGHSYRNSHLEVAITMPDIRKLGISGASTAAIDGFDFDHDMHVGLSGASQIVGTIKTGDLKMNLSGASDVTLKGTGRNLSINASGASTVRMDDFSVMDADLNLSGASKCLLNVDGEMDIHASGASKVKYCGKGQINSIDISGASKVRRM